jgi:hypothetical protein
MNESIEQKQTREIMEDRVSHYRTISRGLRSKLNVDNIKDVEYLNVAVLVDILEELKKISKSLEKEEIKKEETKKDNVVEKFITKK